MMVANALSSWLDYCNSFFGSLYSFNVRKLQSIQFSLAIISTKTTRIPLLKSLYQFPVEQRLVFKTATRAYMFLPYGHPSIVLF